MMKRFMILPLALAAISVNAAEKGAVKPDTAAGQKIAAEVCAGCHNADGNSAIPANPRLAGQLPEYLYKQLTNFKAAEGKEPERNNAIMGGMVAALSDADMKSLAGWFAKQQPKAESQADPKLLKLGQKLYRAGDASKGLPACSGCHGPAGGGMPAQYPRLGGQWAEYVETQLKSFRAEERANDPNKMMRMVAIKMTDPEIKAVADYIAAMR
ncbi:MAG: c-type cytochrome [Rhodocyclaceae bacterium]|jgi:cytochrome c553